jgi:ABC-type glycerol-3-phosphate transport system substrate-binding protein
MQRSNTFQIVVIGTFVVLLILGFLGFAGKLPLPSSGQDINYGTVTMWGTVPATTMERLIGETLNADSKVKISYTEKKPATFNNDFVDALARGAGPDLILIGQDSILKSMDKLTLIPYTSVPERDFRSAFIPEAELFIRPEGIVALPFTIDPIIMYWNRDIFTNALVVAPPTLWTQFYDLVPKITVRSTDGDITRSLVSFGEYNNVSHAKEVISLLLMQAGSPIVKSNSNGLSAALVLPSSANIEDPVMSAIRFYTEFSKPGKDAYSWNRSLPYSRTMFESGDLALYFGYASEFKSIQTKNPHLNFDITMVPQAGQTAQGSQGSTKLTFGQMRGVAITRSTQNAAGALYAALLLSSKDSISALDNISGLPPVRRDLIAMRPTDPVLSVFYDSALISRGWYDPAPDNTDTMFLSMLDNITSGRNMISEALAVAQNSLDKLLSVYAK